MRKVRSALEAPAAELAHGFDRGLARVVVEHVKQLRVAAVKAASHRERGALEVHIARLGEVLARAYGVDRHAARARAPDDLSHDVLVGCAARTRTGFASFKGSLAP
jgi:hypothetical protein